MYYLYTTLQDAPFIFEWKLKELESKKFIEVSQFNVNENWEEEFPKCFIAVDTVKTIYDDKNIKCK